MAGSARPPGPPYALDRESIVNDILLGYADVAQGTQPVVSYAYAPEQITTQYAYDPEKANSLLAEAGWTEVMATAFSTRTAKACRSNCSMAEARRWLIRLVAYMQDAWKQFGIDARRERSSFRL